MKKTNKYGIIKVISQWLDLLPQIFDLWRIFIGYAAVLTVLGALLNKWSYTCSEQTTGFWCSWFGSDIRVLFGTSVLWAAFAFYFYCIFTYDFYENMIGRRVFQFKDIFLISKQRLKSVAFFLGCLIAYIVPCAVLMWIINPMKIPAWHTANPDWRVELIYFTIAFVCMMMPLIIMRCTGSVACFFNEGSISFRKIYRLTRGRAYVGIFSFLLLMIVCINLHISTIRYFNKIAESYNFFVTAVATEFCSALMILLYFALFLLLFQAEYLILKEKEEQKTESTNLKFPVAPEITEDDAAQKTKARTKKSAKKKKTQRKAKKLQEK